MRRIIFLLTALFGCLQISGATIDLTKIVGTLDNSVKNVLWTGETISVTFKGAKYGPNSLQLSDINKQLFVEGVTGWLMAESITTCNDPFAMVTYVGTIRFKVARMGGTLDRIVTLVANNGTNFRIIQALPKQVTCSATVVHPSDKYTVTVAYACPGVSYSLYRSMTKLQTIRATTTDVVFSNVSGQGVYTVRDDRDQEMKTKLSVRYYWPFDAVLTDPSAVTGIPVDKNGGTVKMVMHTSSSSYATDIYQLFDRYNAGEYWDNQAMRIELENIERNGLNSIFYVNVYCAPNISSKSVANNPGFDFSNLSWNGIIVQPAGGGLTACTINSREESDLSRTILLTNTQHLVKYELYNNNKFVLSLVKQGDKDIYFYKRGPGIYTIKSVYKTYSRSQEGVCKVQLDKFIQQEPLITCDGQPALQLDKDGGMKILSCKRNPHVDDATIRKVIQEFNAANAYVTMQLENSTEANCDIRITWNPNFSSTEVSGNLKFLFCGTDLISYTLPAGGEFKTYNVSAQREPSPAVVLDGSQIGIVYEVCRESFPIGVKMNGTGNALRFSVPMGSVYSIVGENTVSGERRGMKGVAVLLQYPEDYFTNSATAISTKTYYEDGAYYTDITYYNGLGAPSQTVHHLAANGDQNLVTPILYDKMYRSDAKVPLPFVVNDYSGQRVDSLERDQAAYYAQLPADQRDNSAFAVNVYDRSGLNRIVKSYRPGDVYRQNDKFAEYAYGTNTEANDRVLAFSYDFDSSSIRVSNAPAGKFLKNTINDEDGGTVIRFTDAEGRLVLERRSVENGWSDTYFIYDAHYGLLRWVISPEASRTLYAGQTIGWSDNIANQYCYRYRYDGRGNLIERQLPGRGREEYVYDRSNRLRLTRDGMMNSPLHRWLYNYYDHHGNLIWQTLLRCESSRAELQAKFDALPAGSSGASSANPKEIPFDDIDATVVAHLAYYMYGNVSGSMDLQAGFLYAPSNLPTYLKFAADSDFPAHPQERPAGLKTYERLAVLKDMSNWTDDTAERAYYYDYKNRPIQIVERNPDGGTSRTYYAYDIPGNVIRSKEVRQPAAGCREDILTRRCRYDNRRRLTAEVWTLNGTDSTTVQYDYDELGKLVGKRYPDSSLNTTLKYNLQGWLTTHDSEQFSMSLSYQTPRFDTATPSYTGNISEWEWQNGSASDRNAYVFDYDKAGRLTNTRQFINGARDDQFLEKNLMYDFNGNIRSLHRMENGTVKNSFAYGYNGNILNYLSDNALNYSFRYDGNGNLTSDGLHGFSVLHNHLNRIESVMGDSGLLAKYSYLWDGTKLMASDASGDGLVYLGSFVYRKQNDSLRFESAGFTEGRFVAGVGSQIDRRYFVADHLGSVRTVVNGSGQVLERSDYQPFGLRWNDNTQIVSDNRYRYNGKEDQSFVSLPYSDYGARMYDPNVGRWIETDPLAEKYRGNSPYSFCGSNPIAFTDPDGRDSIYVFDQPQRPRDRGVKGETYTAEVYVEISGSMSGPYRGSSYPNSKSPKDNSTASKTLSEGRHLFNNRSGHKGGTVKGLNIVDETGKRASNAQDPQGNEVTITDANVHSGYSDNGGYMSRGSKGCITIHPDDAKDFFGNFKWNDKNPNTGTSAGAVFIYRTDNVEKETEYKSVAK